MDMLRRATVFMMLAGLALATDARSAAHPGLILTRSGVEQIRAGLGQVPLFDAALASARDEVDAEISLGIDTPLPKDFSGGYTHERHKRNFFAMQKAGVLFQLLEDEKYAVYVGDMLFQYEAMYKDLPLHPQTRSYARGKLFWQCLNDANWLVYASQAYDAIYDWLAEDERARLEENLFRPFADFLSVGNPQFFNRVHNHSTWGNAAVGMIGLVMGDDELVQRALYGIEDDGLAAGVKDDDGGYIKVEGQGAGFFANLEEPFSPDGYYTEGPYYQRYAMYPFLIFAQGLHNVKPELGVFDYKDGVLLKAVNTLLTLSDADGEFFPLNDAQKGMSIYSRELVTAVDIAYHFGGRDPRLLDVAAQQQRVSLDEAGFSVARGIRDGLAQPFEKTSVNLADGSDGREGGVAILRYGNEDLALVFKYAAQGLSHGHYDKLSISLYEQGSEVLQDYGLARFVNIEQKGGGNYLPENASWAKQTIAHNTVTQNMTSHFSGLYDIGSQHHSELAFYDDANENVQVVSATESNAYPGTEMRRTLAMIKAPNFEKPFVLDVFRLSSDSTNRYELPFWYMGQVLQVNASLAHPQALQPIAGEYGYQHLFLEASGTPSSDNARFQWMGGGKFYTLTTATLPGDELRLVRLGANDPDFNLRRDAAFVVRRDDAGDTVFASVIEPHGSYDPVTEVAANSSSNVAKIAVVHDDERYTAVALTDRQGREHVLILSNQDTTAAQAHRLRLGETQYEWTGPYYYAESPGGSSSPR